MKEAAILQDPKLTLFADSNEVVNYKRDPHNYITQVFGEQLPAIRTGFFNVHLTKGIIVQPHWHTNATEMVFVISGEVMTSVFDPFTQKVISYRLTPGQVAILPKGWFHWIVTLSEKAHALTIFDVPTPDIVFGSDFLRKIPKEVMNLAYCVNEEEYAKAVAPIQQSIILGPPPGCSQVQALQEAPSYGYGAGHGGYGMPAEGMVMPGMTGAPYSQGAYGMPAPYGGHGYMGGSPAGMGSYPYGGHGYMSGSPAETGPYMYGGQVQPAGYAGGYGGAAPAADGGPYMYGGHGRFAPAAGADSKS